MEAFFKTIFSALKQESFQVFVAVVAALFLWADRLPGNLAYWVLAGVVVLGVAEKARAAIRPKSPPP